MPAERPGAALHDHRASPASAGLARSAARRSRSSTSRPRRPSSTSPAARRDRCRVAKRASRHAKLLAGSGRSCRPTARCATGAPQASQGRGRHDLVRRDPPAVPARVRRHRALRRRVRDLQHALDHGRPAHARARDPADARRLAPPGARLGGARGARDRRARLGRRARARTRLAKGSTRSSSGGRRRPAEGGTVLAARTVVVALLAGISSRCSPGCAGDPRDARAADRRRARGVGTADRRASRASARGRVAVRRPRRRRACSWPLRRQRTPTAPAAAAHGRGVLLDLRRSGDGRADAS